jgi:hypothetical protein
LERRKNVQGFSGKAEGKIPLRRPRRRWEDGITMGLAEIGWGWSRFSWLMIETGGGFL